LEKHIKSIDIIRAKDTYNFKSIKVIKRFNMIIVNKKFRSYKCQLSIEEIIHIARAK